jgi:hypothetical protein
MVLSGKVKVPFLFDDFPCWSASAYAGRLLCVASLQCCPTERNVLLTSVGQLCFWYTYEIDVIADWAKLEL